MCADSSDETFAAVEATRNESVVDHRVGGKAH